MATTTHPDGDLAEGGYVPPIMTPHHTIPPQYRQILKKKQTVYTPADTQLAIDHNLDGIIISNHGGRQLDGVPAALDVLRLCAPVARGRIPVAVDGGVRRGADVFKALALGADFCFVGRVAIWGLAVFSLLLFLSFSMLNGARLMWVLQYDGENGVDLAIRLIREELKRTMMLTGWVFFHFLCFFVSCADWSRCRTIKDISLEHLAVLEASGRLARL